MVILQLRRICLRQFKIAPLRTRANETEYDAFASLDEDADALVRGI